MKIIISALNNLSAKALRLAFLIVPVALGPVLSSNGAQSLPTVENAPCREALEAKIEKAKTTVERFGFGHVVVGRVMLDGPGDPRDVTAQMEILPDGYFAGPTKDLTRPLHFRMHQYAPLVVELKEFSGDIVDLGTLHLKRLPPEKLASLTGRIECEEGVRPAKVSVTLSAMNRPVNTPHNGSEPRRYWPTPIKAEIDEDGAVTAAGFSPIQYYCGIKAPGYLNQSFPVTFKPGEAFDLGTIRLERPVKIALSYIVAEKPPFDLSKKQQTVISGGDRWKSVPDGRGWDLEFKQRGDNIVFNYFYAPCTFQDLGPGTLEEMVPFANRASAHMDPQGRIVENDFIYIFHQKHFKRWILLKVEIKENEK